MAGISSSFGITVWSVWKLSFMLNSEIWLRRQIEAFRMRSFCFHSWSDLVLAIFVNSEFSSDKRFNFQKMVEPLFQKLTHGPLVILI